MITAILATICYYSSVIICIHLYTGMYYGLFIITRKHAKVSIHAGISYCCMHCQSKRCMVWDENRAKWKTSSHQKIKPMLMAWDIRAPLSTLHWSSTTKLHSPLFSPHRSKNECLHFQLWQDASSRDIPLQLQSLPTITTDSFRHNGEKVVC